MASKSYFPDKDGELLTWAQNFSALITADPTEYGLDVAHATALAALVGDYQEKYATATAPSTRTKPTILAKDDSREAMKENIRFLVKLIEGTSTVTNELKAALGLTIPKDPSPVPPPAEPPVLEVVSRLGTTVRIKLHDGSGTRRAKPDGVTNAVVFKHVGESFPVDINEWTLVGNATKTIVDVEFDPMLAPGTTVWFTAFWQNGKGQNGPGCPAVNTVLAGGAMEQAA